MFESVETMQKVVFVVFKLMEPENGLCFVRFDTIQAIYADDAMCDDDTVPTVCLQTNKRVFVLMGTVEENVNSLKKQLKALE